MLELKWGTCQGNNIWCSFAAVNLEHPAFNKEGVYIVWQKGGRIIKVGRGQLKNKITEERQNALINIKPGLLVTWAAVESKDRTGVVKYLIDILKPEFIDVTGDTSLPVAVNLPWPYKTG